MTAFQSEDAFAELWYTVSNAFDNHATVSNTSFPDERDQTCRWRHTQMLETAIW